MLLIVCNCWTVTISALRLVSWQITSWSHVCSCCRSVLSSPVKSEAVVPTTQQVIAEIRRTTEKRKREDSDNYVLASEPDDIRLCPGHTSAPQTHVAESKRRRPDASNAGTRDAVTPEFAHPSAVETPGGKVDSKASNRQTAVAHAAAESAVSPIRDGHLRTAIASSYSSSQPRLSRVCTDLLYIL